MLRVRNCKFLHRISILTTIFLLSILPSAAASQQPHSQPTDVYNTSDDAEGLPTVSLHSELVIGEDGVFGRPADVAVSATGRIFVLDAGFQKVYAFDDEGRQLFSFGRDGEGPGEFMRPSAVAVGPGDTLFVAGRQKINVFAPSGRYVRSYTLHSLDLAGAYARTIRVSTDRAIYLSAFDVFEQLVVHKISPEGKKLVSFSNSYAVGSGEDVRVERTFAGGSIDLAADGDIFYSQLTPYEIRRFTPDGRLVSVIHRENDFMSPPHVERAGGGLRIYLPSGSYGLVVLNDGRIVNNVFLVEGDREKTETGKKVLGILDVFDSQGRLVQTSKLDRKVVLKCHASGNRFYGIETQDIYTVVRYRLE